MEGEKKCRLCREWRSLDQYTKRKGTADGLFGECKACRAEQGRNLRGQSLVNGELVVINRPLWERANEKMRLKRDANIEKARKASRDSYAKHKGRIQEHRKEYYLDNREEILDGQKKKRREHPENARRAERASYYKYHDANKERKRVLGNASRAKKRVKDQAYYSTPEGKLKRQAYRNVRRSLMEGIIVQPEACAQCGKATEELHGHHYAGYDLLHQLVIKWLCTQCHGEAHRKTD